MSKLFHSLLLILAGLPSSNPAISQCFNTWGNVLSGLPNGNVAVSSPLLETSWNDSSLIIASGFFNTDTLVSDGIIDENANASSINMGIAITKIDNHGNTIWINSINSTGFCALEDMQVNTQGGIYLAGQFKGTLNLSDTAIYNNNQGFSYFLFKFDTSGQLIWSKTNQQDGNGSAAIGVSDQNLVTIIGFSDSLTYDATTYYADTSVSTSARDFLVVNMDHSGSAVWINHISGKGTGMIRDCEVFGDKIFIQGVYDHELIINDDTLSGSAFGEYHLFFTSLALNTGATQWLGQSSTFSNSPASLYPRNSIQYNDSLIIAVGNYSTSDVEIAGEAINSSGMIDAYLLGINEIDGTIAWLKGIGADNKDEVLDIVRNEASAVIIGYFKSDSLNLGSWSIFNYSANNNADPFIATIDDQGKVQCVKDSLGRNDDEVGLNLAFNGTDIHALFSFNGQIEVDDINYQVVGLKDLLLAQTCLPCDTITTTNPIKKTPNFTLSPNPFTDQTTLQWQQNLQKGSIKLYDLTGRKLREETVNGSRHTLQRNGLAAGVYVLVLYEGGEFLGAVRVVVSGEE